MKETVTHLNEQYLRFPNLLRTIAGFATIAALIVIGLFSLTAGCAYAQSPSDASAAVATSLKFEVASIKPSAPGRIGFGVRPAPGGERYLAENTTLKILITVAYRIKEENVIGGPTWIDSEHYDMNAKAERPSSIEELHTMLKNLLADEFKLQFHFETKELPVYALVLDKDGPKMTPRESKRASDAAGESWIEMAFDRAPGEFLKTTWHATLVPMDYFAFRLGEILDRPVIDLTRLTGRYDFDLPFTRELPPGAPPGALSNGSPIDTSGPTIFEAVRKLGLRLERQRGPVEIMVVDRAEKPAGN